MWKKVLAAFIALVLIFALGLAVGVVAKRWLPFRGESYNTAAILTRVQNLNQLVTVKYVLEKVIVYDDLKWYGNNRVLLVAHGNVNAGIDLGMIKAGDLEVIENTVRLRLPPPRVTDVYLDDRRTEVLERSTGILRQFDKDLEQNARAIAVADLRRAAAESGILKDASERARVELTALFYQLGFTSVDIRDK